MKHLRAITSLPYVTPAGRLVTAPGYDPQTQLYLNLPPIYHANIPLKPSPDQVCQALKTMMAPWAGYVWTGADDVGAMLSAIIAAVVRPVLPLCPAYLFDAASPGSGKTLAARALGALTTGRRVGVHTVASDGSGSEDELRKKVLSSAIGGDSFICLDNVTGFFKSAVLAGYLTSGRISDRVLGQSRVVDCEVLALVTLTGNNAALWADLQRRIVRPRINSGIDPTRRRFAWCPHERALHERVQIAEAVCTLLTGWFAAGAPKTADDDAGGFTDWSSLCRQSVLWASREGFTDCLAKGPVGDPAASLMADAGTADPEVESLGDLLRQLHALTDGAWFTAKEAAKWVALGEGDDEGVTGELHSTVVDLLGGRKAPTALTVGRLLSNRRDRHCRGLVLSALKDKGSNSTRFKVQHSE
jgi:hypothetical protein